MTSTFPHIVRKTPAVLRAVAKEAGLTPEQYRIGTLKAVSCEIGNLLDPATIELHPDYSEVWERLLNQVETAIADG
jgi:hypothetical protein